MRVLTLLIAGARGFQPTCSAHLVSAVAAQIHCNFPGIPNTLCELMF